MTLPIFYMPQQSSDAATGYSPSAGKPAKAVADWLAHPDIAPHIRIESFEPATDMDLCLAHDPSYVEGVLTGEIENGFGNCSLDIAQSLRYTTGSLLAAARYALTSGNFLACSPTSGFHHAQYSMGGGFCTFNGLVVTAIRMKHLGLVNKVLILDMDQHYGNGTQDIIDRLGLDWITHITAGKSYTSAGDVERTIRNLLPTLKSNGKNKVDLVLYQAGADIHVDDPLGGILTTEQMRWRDKMVFSICGGYEVPCAFTLAGGYQRDSAGTIEPVLALHRQTIAECIKYRG